MLLHVDVRAARVTLAALRPSGSWRFRTSRVAAHDDTQQDEEHAHGEQEIEPARPIEHECTDGPDDDQHDSRKQAEVHERTIARPRGRRELTGRVMVSKLPLQLAVADYRDGELRF